MVIPLLPATVAYVSLPEAWPEWLRWALVLAANLAYLTAVCYVVMGWRAWRRPQWPDDSSAGSLPPR